MKGVLIVLALIMSTQALLFNQTTNMQLFNAEIIAASTFFTNGYVLSIDHFEIPADNGWFIEEVNFFGKFSPNFSSTINNWKIQFLDGNLTVLHVIDTQSTSNGSFSIDPIYLTSGTYWVGAGPVLGVAGTQFTDQYWQQYTVDRDDTVFAKYQDENKFYYSFGSATWFNAHNNTHLAFSINGTAINSTYPKLDAATVAPTTLSFNDQTSVLVTVTVKATDLNKGIKTVSVKINGPKQTTIEQTIPVMNMTVSISVPFRINKTSSAVGTWNIQVSLLDFYNRTTMVNSTSSFVINPFESSSSTTTEASNLLIKSEKSSNTGAIVGGVVGGIAGIAIVGLLFYIIILRKKNKKQEAVVSELVTINTENNGNKSVTTGYENFEENKPIRLDQYAKNPFPIPETIDKNAILMEDYIIDYKELEFEKEIGRGAFGVVFKGLWRSGQVAIKQLLVTGEISERELEEFKAEAALMKKIRPHVNIVQFLGITSSPNPMCIVAEFLSEGSLKGFLQSEQEMDTNALKSIVKGVCAGMLHLHKEGVIHRDLAARNVLMQSGFKVKISDFGMSRKITDPNQGNKTKNETGPLKWMAPEQLSARQYSIKTDAWAFGITLYEIVTRGDPYPDMTPMEAALAVYQSGHKLAIPENCPVGIAEVIKSTLNTNPDERPDFEQMSNYFRDIPEESWLFK